MKPVTSCDVSIYTELGIEEKNDYLIAEEPIQFIYNGLPHMIMMCTPQNLEDLAYGFSLTEGIVQSISQVNQVTVDEGCNGIELRIEIEPLLMSRLEGAQRKMSARTGCGVCGVEDLSLVEKILTPVQSSLRLNYDIIQNALWSSRQYQEYGDKTGASHAAFLCDELGKILLVREDVGRHVALDKLIGAIMQKNLSLSHTFILMSSRASFEIVQKTVAIKVPTLVTMSAPTDKAVQLAKKYGLSLWGFARKGRVNCYVT